MSSEFVFDMSEFDFEQLAEQLERCGAKRFPGWDEATAKRWGSGGQICIPVPLADHITAALLSVPQKQRRPKLWSRDIESRAYGGLLEDEPINSLAREIAAATGQSVPTARRRLQEMKADLKIEEVRASLRRVFAEEPEGAQK